MNGRTIAVSASDDETVRVWDLAAGKQIGEPFEDHGAPVRSVAFGRLPDGRAVAVSASSGSNLLAGFDRGDNGLRVWDLAAHRQLRKITHDDGRETDSAGPESVAVGELADGRTVAISSTPTDGRIWDLATGAQIGRSMFASGPVATGVVNGRAIGLTGCKKAMNELEPCKKRAATVRDLATGRPFGKGLAGERDHFVGGAAVGELNGRPIVVSGTNSSIWPWKSRDHAVRVWDLGSGRQIGEPLKGHPDDVQSVAVGNLGGRSVAVAGGGDLRVWDLGAGKQIGRPFTGPDNSFSSVALGELNGRPIAVSGGRDKTVRVWDLGPPFP
ncbi:hypothetical protein E1287_04255 [Actinomadura sp. KC06]|uniref:WD40 repeat domain-containing protein n=1 Tax=Actinomadura sp. KC06 TaxID=2530369 RepID=UPI001049B13E|nr:hypothetical protein [Actinomadura sp. KC06]TDD39028.1 hypothetical protein E1287_04255 [Actinomadura sp. KC06]